MLICLESQVSDPIGLLFIGLLFNRVYNSPHSKDEELLPLSSIKLERMGLVSKSIETDDQDIYEFYTYSITELGVDELLKNEDVFYPKEPNSYNSFNSDSFF